MQSIHNIRRSIAMLAMGALCAGSAMAQNDWCKSKWGPNDEIGAANLLTPQLAAESSSTRLPPMGVRSDVSMSASALQLARPSSATWAPICGSITQSWAIA